MNLNLDSLLTEVLESLAARGLAAFRSEIRGTDPMTSIYWDVQQHPLYDEFLDAAVAGGVKLVTVYVRRFDETAVAEALEQLEESDMDSRGRRDLENQLKELRIWTGRIGQLELAFVQGHFEYVFDLTAEWFEEYTDLIDTIESSYLSSEDQDEPPLAGGYYSRN